MIGTSILGLSSLAGIAISKSFGGNFYHLLFGMSILCILLVLFTSIGTRVLKRILR